MHAAVRPYVTAGVALVGTGVIAAASIAPPPDIPAFNLPVRLAADSSSIANIPLNLIEDILNMPANELAAQNQWATALAAGGSWWLKTPTNVWGWDPGNPPMFEAFVAMLVPIPSISGNGGLPSGANPPTVPIQPGPLLGGTAPPGSLGYILNAILAAELPMNEGCGFTCPDIIGELSGWFQVPLSDLMSGYTFPNDIVDANQPGYPVPWSGQTVALDPLGPIMSYIDHLMAPPSGVTFVSWQDVITTNQAISDADNIAFNGWFPGSYLFMGIPTLYGFPTTINGLINGLTGASLPTSDSATTIPALIPLATFLNSLAGATTSPTNISTLAAPNVLPNTSANTLTVTTNPVPQAPSPNRQRDIQTGTPSTRKADSTAAPVFDAGSQTVAPEADQWLDAPSTAAAKPNPSTTTTTSKPTSVTRGGNKAEPDQVGNNNTTSGGRLTGPVKSVTDRISSGILDSTGGLKGGGAKTGTSGTGGTGK